MNSVNVIKGNLCELMVDDTQVDELVTVLNSRIKSPEKFKFVELLQIVDVLKYLFKVLVGLEKFILFDGSETFEEVEEEMILEIFKNDLIDDSKSDIGLDDKCLELVVFVELLDGLDVVGLQKFFESFSGHHVVPDFGVFIDVGLEVAIAILSQGVDTASDFEFFRLVDFGSIEILNVEVVHVFDGIELLLDLSFEMIA